MNNPWATTWEQPDNQPNNRKTPIPTPSWNYTIGNKTQDQEEDIGLPSWSASNDAQWPESSHTSDALWTSSIDDSGVWGSSTYAKINLSRRRITEAVVDSETQDEVVCPVPAASEEDNVAGPAPPDSVEPHLVPPTIDLTPQVPDSPNVDGDFEASPSVKGEDEETEDDSEVWADPVNLSIDDGDEWGAAWVDTSASEVSVGAGEPLDEWESARQEKEKLNRAVPPEMMAALVQKCQEVSGELWPGTAFDSDTSNWRTGVDGLENIAVLLNDLIPENMVLSPPTQFSQTATAKELNNALKLTRHMPLTRKSPMALLLSSKGSTDWEKSVKARKDIPVDDAPAGWRILEKDERATITDPSHPKKPGAGLLSFWNRKASSSILSADAKVENARPPSIPARSSIDNTKPQVPDKRDVSPVRTPTILVPSSPVASSSAAPDVMIPTVTPAPSAVSRFLNRFSRARGTGSERKSIALSTDDLDFLSDIVPSAHDPDDDTDDAPLKALSSLINSNPTPLPTKLPPPLAPPPKPPSVNASRPPSVGLSGLGITLEPARSSPHHASARALSLPPPLSPVTSEMSFSRPHSPAVPPKPSSSINTTFSAYTNPIIPAATSSPPQPSSRTHSPLQLPPPPKAPSALSIPPLLPPPISPPQTPRPSVHPIPGATLTSFPNTGWAAAAFQDDDDDDDSFSAFSNLPRAVPFPAPRESIDSSLNSPSSAQALNSSKSSNSMSFDDFDDFVTSSQIRTPSPPPVPAKPSKMIGGAVAAMPSSRPGTSIHIRTQSLLEHAATQRGQWPSPLNAHSSHPVLPPPSASPSFGRDMDLLSDGGAVLSAPKFGTPPPKVQSTMVPQLSPSPPLAPLPQPLLSFASLSPSSSRAERPPAKPVQTGGLTAQDLSFFEGL